MPIYLSKTALKEAVRRLGESSAAARLGDFLVFKRALEIKKVEVQGQDSATEPTDVVTGTKSQHFVQAIEQLTLCHPDLGAGGEAENPYFVPFGATREKNRGYRSHKYPSNGSSDTVSRWQSQSATPPLKLVPGTSPKAFRFEERSKQELESFFIVKGAQGNFSGERPRILDTAIWWFRFTDLEERFQREPTEEELIDAAITDLGLNDAELDALFTARNENLLDLASQVESTTAEESL
ncbi:hypothetical protein [Streptomyces gobiensis]|uniref:hypothetical protein n=1 Tax=Streptomyces gobiensis TaxID=2875706 RepID=UPI001E38283A|nr:hypothetical protein [Streptomyces gobiensis]UGY92791.1 hypothetical protein test1122_14425 [Streptomyces gobiensis]